MNKTVALGVAVTALVGLFAAGLGGCGSAPGTDPQGEERGLSLQDEAPPDVVAVEVPLYFPAHDGGLIELQPGAYAVAADPGSNLIAVSSESATVGLIDGVLGAHEVDVDSPSVVLVPLGGVKYELVVAIPNGATISAIGSTVSRRGEEQVVSQKRQTGGETLRERLNRARPGALPPAPAIAPPVLGQGAKLGPSIKIAYWMEPRFGLDKNQNGVVDIPNTPKYVQALDQDQGGRFLVHLKPEVVNVPPQTSAHTYRWRIHRLDVDQADIVREHSSAPAPQDDRTLFRGIEAATYLLSEWLEEGSFRIDLTVEGGGVGGNAAWSKTGSRDITIDDILIVSIGDSYSSGEGNPERVNRVNRKLTVAEAALALGPEVLHVAEAILALGAAPHALASLRPRGLEEDANGEDGEQLSYRGWDPRKKAKSLANKAKDTGGSVVNKAKDTASTVADKAKDTAGSVVNKAKDTASTVADKTKDTAGKVGGALGDAKDSTVHAAKKASHTFGKFSKGALAAAKDKAEDTKDWIEDRIDDLIDLIPLGSVSTRDTYWADDGESADGAVRRVIVRQMGDKKRGASELLGSSQVARDHARNHRSSLAWPAQVALSIERGDRLTSVTFVSVAQSGATIAKGILGPYGGRYVDAGVGVKDSRRAQDASKSQLDQVRDLVGNRTIDALLVTVGGNDVGFSQILTALTLKGWGAGLNLSAISYEDVGKALHDGRWGKALNVEYLWGQKFRNALCGQVDWSRVAGLDGLPGEFERMRAALHEGRGPKGNESRLKIRRVYLLECPDVTGGMQCDRMLEAAASSDIADDYLSVKEVVMTAEGAFMDREEIQWAYNNVYLPLNAALESAVDRANSNNQLLWKTSGYSEPAPKWCFVKMGGGFKGHGICAGPPIGDFESYRLRFAGIAYPNGIVPDSSTAPGRWFRTLTSAMRIQGEMDGGVHPNEFGHQEMKKSFLEVWNKGERPPAASRIGY